MMTDIIQIPLRDNINNVYSNYWILYEETYKKNFELNDYKFNNIKSQDEIFTICDTLENIKNNFYNIDSNIVLCKLIIKYMDEYFKKFENKLFEEVNEFLAQGKISNFHKLFLSYNLKCNAYFLQPYSDILNEYINNIDSDKEIQLVKFMLFFNKLIDHIDKNDNKENLIISKLICNISTSLSTCIIKFIKKKGNNFYNDLLNKPYYNKIFKNNKIIRWFNNDSKLKLYIILVSNFNRTYPPDELNSLQCANSILDIIKINNIIYDYYDNDIDYLEKNNLIKFSVETLDTLTNYICASLYYWMNNESMHNIFNIIKYYAKVLPNKLEFLTYYKYHFQKRVTHNLNYIFENRAYEYLLKEFNDNIFKTNLDNIRNSLDDVYLSDHMNNEINKLNITFQNPDIVPKVKQMDNNYNINKLNVFISSNVMWNSENKIKFYENMKLSDDIYVYSTIINNYYKSKYDKRELKLSYNDSFIDITLGVTEIRMPFTYYTILKIVGNNSDCTLEQICRSTNLDISDIKDIINILKINNIIIENTPDSKAALENIISLSQNILNKTDQRKLNLMQTSVISDIHNMVKKEIEYDKDMLIDSTITRTCKKLSKISYGRLIMIIRGELKIYFTPNENNIKYRLKRLDELGYIKYDKPNNIYHYIP